MLAKAVWCAIYLTGLSNAFSQTTSSVSNKKPQQSHDNDPDHAIVVGGGPVGLASAIMLANQGYDVSIFEATATEKIRTFDPAQAYLYNVNFRGQTFTNIFPNIHEKMVEKGVPMSEANFMLGPADATKNIQRPNMGAGMTGIAESYWIPRHTMTALLWDAVEEHNETRNEKVKDATIEKKRIGKINFEHDVVCVSVRPNDDSTSISVGVKNQSSGEETECTGKLVVAADGINSKVRDCLKDGSRLFGTWDRFKAKKFQVKKWVSPASGLKLKVS